MTRHKITVVPDEPRPLLPATKKDPDKRSYARLGKRERGLAAAVGSIITIAGSVGTFVSGNQVGTTGMVLVGGAFLLAAVQGTQILKVGKDGLETAPLEELGEEIVDKAELVPDPRQKAGMMLAASIVYPAITAEPHFKRISEDVATRRVMDSLQRVYRTLGPALGANPKLELEYGRGPASNRRYDGRLKLGDGREVFIEVKDAPDRAADWWGSYEQLAAELKDRPNAKGLIVLVNSAPRGPAGVTLLTDQIYAAQWSSPDDDDVLERALKLLLGS